jgi:transposase InsO family protein
VRIVSGMAPGARRLAGHGSELSRDARARLKWVDYYRFHGYNARLTCRHFGIAPQTFYRWRRRYDPKDTLDLRPLPGVILKHFTARDTVSRWDVLEIAGRATAVTASRFLDSLQKRAPFPVRAIQVDGGSEFQAEFERECKKRGILLFVLPPRSPKLNGRVERAHRTHREGFYEVADLGWTVAEVRPHLLAWERIYNTVRPHQALGYKTPWQVVCDHRRQRTA